MKKQLLILISNILFSANIYAGTLDSATKDPQLMSALELTYTCNDKDTAFTACTVALKKHKSDEECVLFIRELMVRCPVSSKFEEDMQITADFVVNKSSEPICIGIAWFRKSEHAYQNAKFYECISFCDIALKNLEYDEGECTVEGNISTKTMFEMMTLFRKKKCYENLEQPTKALEIEKCLMSYPYYAKYINENRK